MSLRSALTSSSAPINLKVRDILLGPRYKLVEQFTQRPQLNISVGIATNLNFELQGLNAADGDCVFSLTHGGILLSTNAALGSQDIVVPHADTQQSAWNIVNWDTTSKPEWSANVTSGSDISSLIYWAGLKLSSTSVIATDADQVFFRYDSISPNWQVVYSIAGVDTTVDSGVVLVVDSPYQLEIKIDASRVARSYINGALVSTSLPLTPVSFKPYIGVETAAASTRGIRISHCEISRESF